MIQNAIGQEGSGLSDHYYSRNPQVDSNPDEWSYTLRGKTFRFKTDAGVFSKREVDFGSRLLIEAFVEPEASGKQPIIDVGCGYGPIGLSLADSFSDRTIHMVDVNERALHLSGENARINEIKNVKIYESSVYQNVTETEFAAVVSNPPIRAGKKVVHEILERSKSVLQDGGELWIVIQKKQGAPSAMAKMEDVFGNVKVIIKKKGYYILKSKKV